MDKMAKFMKVIKLPDIAKMSDEEIGAYAKTAWTILSEGDGKTTTQKSLKRGQNKQHRLFEVSFRGSSLVGESHDQEAFNIAHAKISQLRDKGRIKCYTRWCRACTLYRFKLEEDVTGHVVKISFSNVVYLTEKMNMEWNFYNPESEFAKNKSDPEKHFKSLIANKSNPVFYIRLESEEFINKCLGGVG